MSVRNVSPDVHVTSNVELRNNVIVIERRVT